MEYVPAQAPAGRCTIMLPETWQPFYVSIWSAQLLQYHCTASEHTAKSEQAEGCLIAWILWLHQTFPILQEWILFLCYWSEHCLQKQEWAETISLGQKEFTAISYRASAAVEGSCLMCQKLCFLMALHRLHPFFVSRCYVICSVIGTKRGTWK